MQEVEQRRVDGVDVAGAEVSKEFVHLDQAVRVVPPRAPIDQIEALARVRVDKGESSIVDDCARKKIARHRHPDGRTGKHADRAASRQARRVRYLIHHRVGWAGPDACQARPSQYTDCLVNRDYPCDSGTVLLSFTEQELHACTWAIPRQHVGSIDRPCHQLPVNSAFRSRCAEACYAASRLPLPCREEFDMQLGSRVWTLAAAALFASVLTVSAQEPATGAPAPATATVAPSALLDALVAEQVRADEANRKVVHDVLSRSEVRELAEKSGLDLERARQAVSTLDGAELEEIAAQARRVDASLAGGASTLVISTTTIIIILLVVILIIVAVD